MNSSIHFVSIFRDLFFECAFSGTKKSLSRYLSTFYSISTKEFNTGRTALHFAVLGNNKENVLFLLSKGASRHEEDRFGNTPLHYAALSNDDAIISALLYCFDDLYITNNMGETPIAIAVSKKNNNFLRISKPLWLVTMSHRSKSFLHRLQQKLSDESMNLEDIFSCPITFDFIPDKPCAVENSSRWWQIYDYVSLRKCESNPVTKESLSVKDIIVIDKSELKNIYNQNKSVESPRAVNESIQFCSFSRNDNEKGASSFKYKNK